MSSLLVITKHDGPLINIVSPSIGRLYLQVKNGQLVVPGQIIGKLYRLDRCFDLVVPEHHGGTIIAITHNKNPLKLGYGELILTINPHLSQNTAQEGNAAKEPGGYITSPLEGLFYLSSAPDQPPFVKVGDTLSPGQTIGLIEVMKSFYPVTYQGQEPAVITGVTIKSASPVQIGAKLFALG